ncbi:helix-turn-helix domain-containing protein [Gordonia phosphorivorans]|uniref:Helix-turn-helix domain-containing protein n=1 Tax=Gordonia phosphorivorans TaxID=1056982 RepID=A0ABV6H652_9ACTN
MDATTREIGQRIRDAMAVGMTQRALADKAGMTPDAMSRALNGHRGFATVELIGIADLLGVDLQWLATGRPDVRQTDLVARHDWDEASGRRVNGGRRADTEALAPIVELYREAYPAGVPSSGALPEDPADLRVALGTDFVGRFAERVETAFDVDVVKMPELTTSYSTKLEGVRGLIVLVADAFWYRNNWSLAHELGHLALGHAEGEVSDAERQRQEAAADTFAADLLLPRSVMSGVDWTEVSVPEVAAFLWRHGVSTWALRRRLAYLKLVAGADVLAALESSTPRLLRAHLREVSVDPHAVVRREQESAARRFPLGLLEVATRRVDEGRMGPEHLAWALGVPVDSVTPDEERVAEQYFRDMGRQSPGGASPVPPGPSGS